MHLHYKMDLIKVTWNDEGWEWEKQFFSDEHGKIFKDSNDKVVEESAMEG